MRTVQWTVFVLVIAIGVVTHASAESMLARVQQRITSKLASVLGIASDVQKPPKENCPSGWHEVADSRCCPNDHPDLIQGECYESCEEGHDDLVLGTYVGCRDQCEPGYASSINTCKRGASHSARVDSRRQSVSSKLQTTPATDTKSKCPSKHIKVSRLWVAGKKLPGSKKRIPGKPRRAGGCCPSKQPLLIGRRCYPECPDNQDAIMVGSFIGCRARCSEGWNEDHNECHKDGEQEQEREDFPREGVAPVNRLPNKKSALTDEEPSGCEDGYVVASSNYCCPIIRPQLKGLLCYERCSRGYTEAAYGCRRNCPRGWKTTLLTCMRKGRSFSRKGYERKPMPSKARKTKTDTGSTTDPDAGKPLVE